MTAAGRLAIIGTAGRDRTRPMTRALWMAMLADVRQRVSASDILVSGGAAWADHLAVAMFLEGRAAGLHLFLPAPLTGVGGRIAFRQGGQRSSGNAANFYHSMFRQATGVDGIREIAQAYERGAQLHEQPATPGYGAMFARNKLVAQAATRALAYTWGQGEVADGGTADTWRAMGAIPKTHVSLNDLVRQVHEVCSRRACAAKASTSIVC